MTQIAEQTRRMSENHAKIINQMREGGLESATNESSLVDDLAGEVDARQKGEGVKAELETKVWR